MITSQLIQAAEKALSDLPRLYDSESDGLLALEIGPRTAHRFHETHGDEAYRGFLLGVFAERYATGLRGGVLTPEQLLNALGANDENYVEPYPEASLEDFQDELDAQGIAFSSEATADELRDLFMTHLETLENEVLTTSQAIVQDMQASGLADLVNDLARDIAELEGAHDE